MARGSRRCLDTLHTSLVSTEYLGSKEKNSTCACTVPSCPVIRLMGSMGSTLRGLRGRCHAASEPSFLSPESSLGWWARGETHRRVFCGEYAVNSRGIRQLTVARPRDVCFCLGSHPLLTSLAGQACYTPRSFFLSFFSPGFSPSWRCVW